MARDIDYAAIAVKNAMTEKYGRQSDLAELEITAAERLIVLRHHGQAAAGTRDDLLAAVRAAATYEELWAALPKQRG